MPKAIHLVKDLFSPQISLLPTRDGYGKGLVAAGKLNHQVVVLTADLTESTRSQFFAEKFPDRFIQVGVAEQALATIAAGLTLGGKIPFISSYAVFSPGRNWEQIRTTICINDVPVKIAGSHAGLTVGPDGATHQMLEDIALMRSLPNMTVIAPADAIETQKAVIAAAATPHPVYLRFARDATPIFTTPNSPFRIGHAEIFWKSASPQVAIIACGPLLYQALLAARDLDKQQIATIVINCHTIKPLDEKTIIEAAQSAGAAVTVEDHQASGGLGSAIAELLAKHHPVPMEFIAMPDSFGESGQPQELLQKYHLTKDDIVTAIHRVLKRKSH